MVGDGQTVWSLDKLEAGGRGREHGDGMVLTGKWPMDMAAEHGAHIVHLMDHLPEVLSIE
jgi:hypothetical protein